MGSTNKTTYYELSQFIGTDKPAWLQDYNGDMLKIDTGINAAKVAADNAASAASGAQGDATDALTAIGGINTRLSTAENTLGTAVGSINTINSLIGNGTPTTSDQTIIGAINGLEGSIAPREDGAALANSYAIGEQFARGGSVYTALAALTANTPFESLVLNTDYEVSKSIVEQMGDNIAGVHAVKSSGIVTKSADSIKTWAEIIEAAVTDINAVITSLGSGENIVIRRMAINGDAVLLPNDFYYSGRTLNKYCTIAASNSSFFRVSEVHVAATSASYYRNQVAVADGSVTFTDVGAIVPTTGSVEIYYVILR